MFYLLDRDSNGSIELEDLIEIFKEQGIKDMYLQMIEDYFDMGDGNISYKKFRDFILKEK